MRVTSQLRMISYSLGKMIYLHICTVWITGNRRIKSFERVVTNFSCLLFVAWQVVHAGFFRAFSVKTIDCSRIWSLVSGVKIPGPATNWNIINSSLASDDQMSWKSVHNLVRSPADRQRGIKHDILSRERKHVRFSLSGIALITSSRLYIQLYLHVICQYPAALINNSRYHQQVRTSKYFLL